MAWLSNDKSFIINYSEEQCFFNEQIRSVASLIAVQKYAIYYGFIFSSYSHSIAIPCTI